MEVFETWAIADVDIMYSGSSILWCQVKKNVTSGMNKQ